MLRLRLGETARLDLVVHVADDEPHLEMIGDDRREVLQLRLVGIVEIFARLRVEDADCADPVAGGRDERRTGIEADVEFAGHDGVFGKALVGGSVRDDQHLIVEDRMAAEGNGARRFGERQVAPGFQKIPVDVHEGDEPDRRVELTARDRSDPVELRFGVGIEYPILSERLEALLLVHRMRRRPMHGRRVPLISPLAPPSSQAESL